MTNGAYLRPQTFPCEACGHDLRNHHIVRPVYDNRADFRCACGCTVDGTVTPIRWPEDANDQR